MPINRISSVIMEQQCGIGPQDQRLWQEYIQHKRINEKAKGSVFCLLLKHDIEH